MELSGRAAAPSGPRYPAQRRGRDSCGRYRRSYGARRAQGASPSSSGKVRWSQPRTSSRDLLQGEAGDARSTGFRRGQQLHRIGFQRRFQSGNTSSGSSKQLLLLWQALLSLRRTRAFIAVTIDCTDGIGVTMSKKDAGVAEGRRSLSGGRDAHRRGTRCCIAPVDDVTGEIGLGVWSPGKVNRASLGIGDSLDRRGHSRREDVARVDRNSVARCAENFKGVAFEGELDDTLDGVLIGMIQGRVAVECLTLILTGDFESPLRR